MAAVCDGGPEPIVCDGRQLYMHVSCDGSDKMTVSDCVGVCVHVCLCMYVEKATSKLLLDPDWESTLQICDNIRQGDVQ